jgi:hypothetical protein
MPRTDGQIEDDGAVIYVSVAIDVDLEESFRSAGLPVSELYSGHALIDTGASHSAIHPRLAEYLGSLPSLYTTVTYPGDDGENERDVPVHDLRIWLEPSVPPFEVMAIATGSATKGILVIIGRDILDQCTLVYDGPNKRVSLTWRLG